MARVVSIGNQGFDDIRQKNSFYVDKTGWIKEWWESKDIVTLITRPRRFGKTLNMSMLNCFFSNRYQGRSDLFEGLSIWQEEQYRSLQGTYPVLFLSFASVKANNLKDAKKQINAQIARLYEENRYLLDSDVLGDNEKKRYCEVMPDMDDAAASLSLNDLCYFLYKYYDKKVILLLDEYDTPLQESYISGYWEGLIAFTRGLFNAAFKSNPYLERAVMTGITRVSKESIFSDLNNLNVITVTSDKYAQYFGFTKQEVENALQEAGLEASMQEVRTWYDGFVFGQCTEIYNPWSITNYLDQKQFRTYWASTSSNALVARLIQTGSPELKKSMESLLAGDGIVRDIDEQLVFNQLDGSEEAIWSLLLASGYLKAQDSFFNQNTGETTCRLSLTNKEVKIMFEKMIRDWFKPARSNSQDFIKALLDNDVEAMNYYMNEIAMTTFSFFDVSGHTRPESFYHGFVLGLMVDCREDYEIRSNRESGFGRYDIMMLPRREKRKTLPAMIIEFKVHNPNKEATLQDTVATALAQIQDKCYDAELVAQGIEQAAIRHYGFAFEGKKVLIG